MSPARPGMPACAPSGVTPAARLAPPVTGDRRKAAIDVAIVGSASTVGEGTPVGGVGVRDGTQKCTGDTGDESDFSKEPVMLCHIEKDLLMGDIIQMRSGQSKTAR